MPEAAPTPADSNEVIRFHFYASAEQVRTAGLGVALFVRIERGIRLFVAPPPTPPV